MQSPAGARRSKSESRILAAAAAVDTPTSADPNYNNGGLVSAFIRSKEGSGSVTAATTKQQHRLSWDGGSGTATTSGQSMESPSSASEQIPMVKSKDTVNHFLKNKLTSIEETESSGSQSKLLAEAAAGAAAAAAATPVPQPRKQRQRSAPPRVGGGPGAFPDLSFLEHSDAAQLWDTFFLNKQQQQPQVLQQPIPVEEYLLREQLRRCRSRSRRSQQQQPVTPTRGGSVSSAGGPPLSVPSHVRDTESLRMLLPTAHKHLLGPAPAAATPASAGKFHCTPYK